MGLTTVVSGSEAVRTNVAFVSDDFFKVLGVQPVTGRGWLSEETKIGGPPTVIVSHGFWERVLGSRDDFGSTTLRIGNQSFAIVGVMPEKFDFPKSAEVWLPFELYPPQASRRSHGRRIIARLRDDVTLAQTRAELSAIGKQLKQENGTNIDLVDITARPLKEALVGEISQSLLLIMAAVGLLLLVACTNLGNLLLAQATARQREFAVRSALGATRWRLARQFIAENLMLALVADGIGAAPFILGRGRTRCTQSRQSAACR